MSAAAPWSVKGIDPRAREIAKDLARRQGLTLGDWLNRMIMEDSPEAVEAALDTGGIAGEEFERLSEALDRLGARVVSAESRSTLAISGIDQTVLGVLSRLEASEREQVAVAARFEGALEEVKAGHAEAADRLAKVEDTVAQPRAIEALRALETALGKVASHLYESETQTRQSLSQMRADLTGLAGVVERLDQAGAAPPQDMIDGVVQRIVQRLEEAEARTSGAIRGLEASFSEFDQRLRAAEAPNEAPDRKLEQLSQDLARNFETAREDLTSKLELAVDQRFEGVEQSLKHMTSHMQAAEQRSTRAMERMGREVLRVAEALGQRMEGVESRSAQAIVQVGGEVSRIADVMEGRVRKADQVQAESLERLGVEIARITERLADRIGSAERRSAQAIDDVGEQVSRITERLNQRHERSSADLAERIRQSEERTAKLLDEAREKIDQRLAITERRLSEPAAPVAAAMQTPVMPESSYLFAEPDLPPGPFDERVIAPTMHARRGNAPAGYVPPVESLPPPSPEVSPFEADDFDAASMFSAFEAEAVEPPAEPAPPVAEPIDEPIGDSFADLTGAAEHLDQAQRDRELEALLSGDHHHDPEPELDREHQSFAAAESSREPDGPRASTRDLIAQARAAARAASQTGEPTRAKRGLFSGFSIGSKKAQGRSPLRGAMMIAAGAATLGVTTAAVTFYKAQWVSHPRPRADAAAPEIVPGRSALASAGSAAVPAQASMLLSPQAASPSAADASADLAGLYSDAVRRIEGHDKTGLPDLRRAANLGYSPAQFYLAKLYEAGEAGLPKDIAQARRWTERAAENGEKKAMHNLGLYYFEGTGGPRNLTIAAQWFQRAADLGLTDSQYNLARLYEGGFGVSQNPAEAYKWYLIAGRAGDGESKAASDRIRRQLSPEGQVTAERAATAFRPDIALAPTQLATALGAPQTDLALAQRALSHLGYYRGPADGASSPALRLAIQAYQRDQGLAQTGALDPTLASRFAKGAG